MRMNRYTIICDECKETFIERKEGDHETNRRDAEAQAYRQGWYWNKKEAREYCPRCVSDLLDYGDEFPVNEWPEVHAAISTIAESKQANGAWANLVDGDYYCNLCAQKLTVNTHLPLNKAFTDHMKTCPNRPELTGESDE